MAERADEYGRLWGILRQEFIAQARARQLKMVEDDNDALVCEHRSGRLEIIHAAEDRVRCVFKPKPSPDKDQPNRHFIRLVPGSDPPFTFDN